MSNTVQLEPLFLTIRDKHNLQLHTLTIYLGNGLLQKVNGQFIK